MSVPSLASGMITLTRNGNLISRANAPLEFWFLVLSALAVAVFGAWVTIAGLINDRADSDVAALGITGDKMFLYLVLFCVLAVIYSIYLKGVIEGRHEAELRDPVWPFAKACFISALPFAVLAWFDKPWRSSDAAPVSVVAWVAVFGAFSLKYPGQCPFAAFLLFVPLVFSALVGHTVGTLCQKANRAI